jgi:chitinase
MKITITQKAVLCVTVTLVILILLGCFVAPVQNDINGTIHNRFTESYAQRNSGEINVPSEFQESPRYQSEQNSSTQTGTPSSFMENNNTILSQSNSNPAVISKPAIAIKNYMVGYYTSWSRHSGFTPDKIDVSKLTHINYAFVDINSSLQLVMDDSSTDLKNFKDLRNLKNKNPALKIIISVGGWDNSKRFSDAALTDSSRETFARSCISFILEHGLDGVDLDWEYPVSGGLAGNAHRPQDKQNYTKLVQKIRQKLNAQTAKDGKRYFLTVTGAPDKDFINKIEPINLVSYIDYLFIMGYDMHGPWEDKADFNAPLYSQNQFNVNQGIANYLNAGVSPKKLVLGMPFYGYCYEVTNLDGNGFNRAFTSSKSISYDSVVSQFFNNSAYSAYYDEKASVPYLLGNHTFITYENSKSIAQKAWLAKKYGLAGVGAWELSFDKSATLLSSAYAAFQ